MENLPRIIEVLLSWLVIQSPAIILLIKIFKDDIMALFRLIAHTEAVREKAGKPPVTNSKSTRKPAGAECITVKRVKNWVLYTPSRIATTNQRISNNAFPLLTDFNPRSLLNRPE
jgi:hypothetical protein